jgi:hypothetical protein
MHNIELRTGLRLLAKGGWDVVDMNEEFFEFLCDGEGEQPSTEAEERVLSGFRSRLNEAYRQQLKHVGSGDSKQIKEKKRNER